MCACIPVHTSEKVHVDDKNNPCAWVSWRENSSLAAAAVWRVGDIVTGANLHTGLGVRRRLRALALLDLSGHGQESLLNVGGVLGRGLEEGDSQAVGKLLRRLLDQIET